MGGIASLLDSDDNIHFPDQLDNNIDIESLSAKMKHLKKTGILSDSYVNEISRLELAPDEVDKIDKMVTTDAISNTNIQNTNELIDNLPIIESQLAFYEKVSLVFLLYENADIALQYLIKEETHHLHGTNSTSSLLLEWADQNQSDNWKVMILEALCIIKNYSILRKFGYHKKELNVRFLPANLNTSLFVNKVRKVLYNMCEMFTIEYTKHFLHLLRKDFRQKGIPFQEFDQRYLEMYILFCLSIKYVTPNDLTNFIEILKEMRLDVLVDTLASITSNGDRKCDKPNAIGTPKSSRKLDATSVFPIFKLNEICNVEPFVGNLPDKCSIGSDNSMRTNMFFTDDQCYKIDPDNVGTCLIINQEYFHFESDANLKYLLPVDGFLSDRFGSKVDLEKLKKTFGNFGFQITVEENLTHKEVKKQIYKATQDFGEKDSCFLVIIMSHGIEDAVYGCNSIPLYISEIEKIILESDNKCLLGKPKILILQSCKGNIEQKIIPMAKDEKQSVPHNLDNSMGLVTDGVCGVPEKSDFLLCNSTVPGYASIRSIQNGTWYIQELCDMLIKEAHRTHLLDILTLVNNKISSKSWFSKGQDRCMVPEFKSCLRKQLYLPVNSELNSGPNTT